MKPNDEIEGGEALIKNFEKIKLFRVHLGNKERRVKLCFR